MPTESLRISKESKIRLLTACNHTCCMCREEDKPLSIHIADDDSLSVALCDDCLQLAQSYPEGQKSISPEELRVAKRVWEAAMRRPPESVKYRDPGDKRLFSWGWNSDLKHLDQFLSSQIAMTACEVLASADDLPHARRLLGRLCQLAIWRHDKEIRGRVYDALVHISDVAICDRFTPLAAPVAVALGSLGEYLYYWDDHVRDKEDLAWLGAPLGSLEIMGMRTMTEEGIDVVAEQVENIFLRGLWCQRKEVVSEVVKTVRRLVKRCSGEGEGEFAFSYGERRLKETVQVMLRFIRKNGKAWRYEAKVLRGLVDLE